MFVNTFTFQMFESGHTCRFSQRVRLKIRDEDENEAIRFEDGPCSIVGYSCDSRGLLSQLLLGYASAT